jgi:uncharacterized protein YbjT (DUF2867 family)
MANNILVTGASGTIGSQIVKQLQAANANFAVMTSNADKQFAGVPTHVGAFEDIASLVQAFTGFDTLFLLFPLVGNKVELAKNAVAAAKIAGVKHIVRSSGAGADATSAFALPKLQGTIDALITASGIPATFLRPAGFMQNFATFMNQQVRDGVFYAAHGDAVQSIIDARDIAAVAAKVLINPAAHAGKAYTLTGGQAISHAEAALALSQAVGHSVKYQPISADEALNTMKQWGLPALVLEAMDSLNHIVAQGYAAGVSPDVEALLGRKPITFAQFANDYAAVWK